MGGDGGVLRRGYGPEERGENGENGGARWSIEVTGHGEHEETHEVLHLALLEVWTVSVARSVTRSPMRRA